MTVPKKLLLLIGFFMIGNVVSAQNPDILWQKTLTKDTIPIASIAIAEGKYVAVLKGDEIVILDYMTGDSIRAFTKPKDMYGTDIVLGKNGERLYVYIKPINTSTPNICYLRSWDIQTGFQFSDISMEPTFQSRGGPLHHDYYSFSTSASLNGNLIVVQTSYHETAYGIGESTGTAIKIFNTIDSTLFSRTDTPDSVSFFLNKKNINNSTKIITVPSCNIKASTTLQSGTNNVSFSQSGNYLLLNYTLDGFYRYGSGVTGGYYSYTYGRIKSMIPGQKSFEYDKNIPIYKFSSDDDFLIDGSNLYNIPPTNIFRTLDKIGFVFLPDDNHMLAFHEAGGVVAISNIEKDIWEKIYQGDSLIENIIQTNAARTAFATATNNRITLWKVPDTLQTATLTADFSMSKDSIPIFDSITFSNRTFPMKRGTYYEWNFGDGSPISKEQYPIHKFNKKGVFTINLQVWDTTGKSSKASKTVVVNMETLSSEEPKPSFETTFSILPNPSYGETTLNYTLSQPSPVQIRITDVHGKEVSSWSLRESAGLHTLILNGFSVGAGMYYCTFNAQGILKTIPLVLLK